MELLAQAPTEISWAKDAIDTFGWPGAILIAFALVAWWYVRTYGPDHKEEIKERTKLLKIMGEHVPKQTETLGALSELMTDSRQIGSDVKRDLSSVHAKIGDLAEALVEHGCPDAKEIMAARLAQHIPKVANRQEEMQKRRPDAPPGFGHLPATGQ